MNKSNIFNIVIGILIMVLSAMCGIFWNRVNALENQVVNLRIEMADKVELYPPDEEGIKKIVQKLYEIGQKVSANEVAYKYGENSYYFLEDLYKKYNILNM